MDKEIEALSKISKLFENLEKEEIDRIMRYLNNKYSKNEQLEKEEIDGI